MRTLSPTTIIDQVKLALINANHVLNEKTLQSIRGAASSEKSELGKYVLSELIDNAKIAASEQLPLCQDTGVNVFYIRWGQQCTLDGPESLQEVFNRACREAMKEGYLRGSMVRDPLYQRVNTRDNTPAIIHLEMVPGEEVEVSFFAKGAGADNASQMKMLVPADGEEGVLQTILKICRESGARSCPPWILGIGIGGTFDTVSGLAKKSLLREIGSKHENHSYDLLEMKILQEVNALGIGPQGLGGTTTALAVFVTAEACHAGSLPLAVNIQCHSNRKGTLVI